MTGNDFITRNREIAEDQIVIWMLRDNERLQPSVMLHPVGQGVSDDRDVIARPELNGSISGPGGSPAKKQEK